MRPLGGWNGNIRSDTPMAAPIQTAQRSSVADRPSRAMTATGVALVAISRKIAAWSSRNSVSQTGIDHRRMCTRALATNMSDAPTENTAAPTRGAPAGAVATRAIPAATESGTAALCMRPRHRGRTCSRARRTDSEMSPGTSSGEWTTPAN